MQKRNQKKQKGFISIFAIFFSAIVVSVLTSLYILLLKQIEIMNMDSASFQTLYMADSAFECVIYQEQEAVDGSSIFYPNIVDRLINLPPANCFTSGDSVMLPTPTTPPLSGVAEGRSSSTLTVSLDLDELFDTDIYGKYCAIINANRETRITGLLSTAPAPDSLSISGQSRDCTDNSGTKIVERLIEFKY